MMSQYLSLLTTDDRLLQVHHCSRPHQTPDSLQSLIQTTPDLISGHSEVIQVDLTLQLRFLRFAILSRAVDDLFHGPLKVCRGVAQPKWHPTPLKLTPMAHKGC